MKLRGAASVAAHLYPDVLVALFSEFVDVLDDFIPVFPVGVRIDGRPSRHLPPRSW